MAQLVDIEATDALTHVALRGRLDLTSVEQVELELARQTVDVFASIGVGMLIKIARSMRSYGLIFGVVATGISKETVERLKVNTVFPVVATYDQTLRALMLE